MTDRTSLSIKPLYEKKALCDIVKYIASLLVVNGHLFIFGNPHTPLAPFMNLGACCVSVFFFFSSYGLFTSYERKGKKYLNGFFKKRILKVLFPLLTAYIIVIPVYALLREPINWMNVLETISWGGPYMKFSWYVTEIVILYGLFYFTMNSNKSIGIKRILMTSEVLMIMILLFVIKQPYWYIVSLPGFILGIWVQSYELKLSKLIIHKSLALFVVLWGVTWQWSLIFGNVLPAYRYVYISYFVSCLAFVIIVVCIIYKSTPPTISPDHNTLIL